MERDDIRAARIDRSKVIRQTQMLARGLARKGKTNPLCLGVTIVNNQIVSRRLAVKITIDRPGHQQSFAFAPRFQFLENRTDMLGDKRLILCRGFSSLLELPLSFE